MEISEEAQPRVSDVYSRMIARDIADESGHIRRKVFFGDEDLSKGLNSEDSSADFDSSDEVFFGTFSRVSFPVFLCEFCRS
jgi:hypothetical protein